MIFNTAAAFFVLSLSAATTATTQQPWRQLGDRVDNLTDEYDCVTKYDGHNDEIWEGVDVVYYYAIESTLLINYDILQAMSESSYNYVDTRVSWCFRPNTQVDVGGSGNRKLEIQAMFSSIDYPLLDVPCNFDPINDDVTHCAVVEASMRVIADKLTDNRAFFASMLDNLQEFVEDGLANIALERYGVENVKWLGETMEEVKNGGPFPIGVGVGGGGDGDGDEDRDGSGGGGVVVATPDDPTTRGGVDVTPRSGDGSSNNDENDIRLAFAVSIPLLVLAFLGFLLMKKRKETTVVAARDLDPADDYVLVGTADPPRSFHDGLYHYTSNGACYLSTNCQYCHTTRQNGFLTSPVNADLQTIDEDQTFDPSLPRDMQSFGSGGSMESDETCETTDMGGLVAPSSVDLGNRHSTMNVHSCKSVMCKICNNNTNLGSVTFIPSPTKSRSASFSPASSPSSQAGGSGAYITPPPLMMPNFGSEDVSDEDGTAYDDQTHLVDVGDDETATATYAKQVDSHEDGTVYNEETFIRQLA